MRCERCGEEVECEMHGGGHVKGGYLLDLSRFPFYWCEACLEEAPTVVCAVVHDHMPDLLRAYSSLLEAARRWRSAIVKSRGAARHG